MFDEKTEREERIKRLRQGLAFTTLRVRNNSDPFMVFVNYFKKELAKEKTEKEKR